jgi:hypothetical protein
MSTDVSQIITESSTLAIGFILLSLAFTLVITLLVIRFIRKALGQDRSIVQNGIPARAKILSVRQTGLMLNNQPQVEFQLEVHPPTGMPYQAQAKAVIGLVSIPRFQPGVEIPVKIHPTDLSKVALVPQV